MFFLLRLFVRSCVFTENANFQVKRNTDKTTHVCFRQFLYKTFMLLVITLCFFANKWQDITYFLNFVGKDVISVFCYMHSTIVAPLKFIQTEGSMISN